MQRRRAADGVDGGGDAADERTADQMMADLMEDLNNSSTAVRSVRVLEGGAQEVVVAGAGGPQPGHNGGAQGVMEGLSPDQQAVLRQAAEVLRTGVQLQWQAAPPAALVDAGRRPEHLPGGQQQAERAGGMDPGEGQRGDQRAQGVGDGGLLDPLALPAGGLEPLVRFDLKVYSLLHKVILWFWVLLGRMQVNNKGILLHWCNMLDINLVLVNFFGILLILMGYRVQAAMRTPTESVLERPGYGWR